METSKIGDKKTAKRFLQESFTVFCLEPLQSIRARLYPIAIEELKKREAYVVT